MLKTRALMEYNEIFTKYYVRPISFAEFLIFLTDATVCNAF